MDKLSDIKTKITSEYVSNRIKFCTENQSQINFQMRLKSPSSFAKVNSPFGEVISFTFDPNSKIFDLYEAPFIKLFLIERLTKIGKIARIEEDVEYGPYTNSFYLSKKLICGDFNIALIPKDTRLINLIEEITKSYNSALNFLDNPESSNEHSKSKNKSRKDGNNE